MISVGTLRSKLQQVMFDYKEDNLRIRVGDKFWSAEELKKALWSGLTSVFEKIVVLKELASLDENDRVMFEDLRDLLFCWLSFRFIYLGTLGSVLEFWTRWLLLEVKIQEERGNAVWTIKDENFEGSWSPQEQTRNSCWDRVGFLLEEEHVPDAAMIKTFMNQFLALLKITRASRNFYMDAKVLWMLHKRKEWMRYAWKLCDDDNETPMLHVILGMAMLLEDDLNRVVTTTVEEQELLRGIEDQEEQFSPEQWEELVAWDEMRQYEQWAIDWIREETMDDSQIGNTQYVASDYSDTEDFIEEKDYNSDSIEKMFGIESSSDSD